MSATLNVRVDDLCTCMAAGDYVVAAREGKTFGETCVLVFTVKMLKDIAFHKKSSSKLESVTCHVG